MHFLCSNCVVCEYSCKFNEALISGIICSNLYFRYLILKYWCKIYYEHLQILSHEQISSKSDKVLVSGPIYPNLGFQ